MTTTAKKTEEKTQAGIITIDLLRSWHPCEDGYRRYCDLFPDGADLKTATDGLEADGHYEWSLWLFKKARASGLFFKETASGHRNTGHRNTGGQNTGHRNTGHRNTGDQNTGHRNTGHRNTGRRNTGHWNTGHWNTGHWNTGDQNTGHWNTGDQNTGHFNTLTPDTILAFNKPCSREEWDNATIPDFLYFSPTEWIYDSAMTDQEKIDNPKFYVAGGYLKKIDYKAAFQKAWDESDAEDRALVEKLPNFDADIFLEISGIDVRKK